MKAGAGIWMLGIFVSILLHLGAAAGLRAALQPDPVTDQPIPQSRLNVAAQEMRRSDAAEQAPQSEEVLEKASSGAKLGGDAIASTRASPVATPSDRAEEQALPAQSTAAAKANVPVISSLPTTAAKALPSRLPVAASMQTPFVTASAQVQAPSPTTLTFVQPKPVVSLPETPETIVTLEQKPQVMRTKATLAFPAAGPVDPVSLAAFQSFTQPEGTTGAALRDNLSAALSVPCARMQVTFDPDTTTLQLTGHVPDSDDRGPVLSALRAQMGPDIAVVDNLLVLPAPQCGALTGIAGVGLPQSTDQITNPMIVGENTHARAFRYFTDDALVLTLTAPDYPAYVYVDYFDADGNVIHLTPNEATPLQILVPKETLTVGAENAREEGLFVTIGPPYGQEIAAAFASSVPLYDGLRPLVEPAGAYLDWLKDKVAAARAQNAGFKGEWVYFFVTTAAR
ncbi:DUF4384 domain-containing protein [Sulfitobacter sp. F26204]|uniref:DUF4384 domain-containing protein n=1 Tax=Sulfitobacter sp. F26204 TaxID=2996014 RepID=UPI00225E5D55|nr:DUF4384 domain-containing protein [Sulfitobacter sp. F26204]MCX7561217.1 DUF4384 domain-containing protein [Sulfitobacter sp. F26204]